MARVALVQRSPSLRTAYKRGSAFEYVVRADLLRRGGGCVRSAGSHSPVDLVYGSRKNAQTWGVQCKHEAGMTTAKRAEFATYCIAAGWLPVLATRVRGGFRLERVLADGSLVELFTEGEV